jgi:single-strand DNA-binding protein
MTETVLHMLGHVGTDVDHRRVGEGIDLSTFRLASTPRRWDKSQRGYVDGATNWITVQCWRSLAAHVRDSVRRGDPVIVVGRLKTEEWTKDEVRNTRFVLEATAVGHDLTRGTSSFVKAVRQAGPVSDESADALAAVQEIERDQESVTGPSEPEPADLELDEITDATPVATTPESPTPDSSAPGEGGQTRRGGWRRAS